MKKLYIFFILSLFLISACTQVETSSQLEKTIVIDTNDEVMEKSNEVMEKKSSVKEFNIVAKKWDFNPSTIIVNKGDTVKLNIESIDVAHGIVILDFGVNEKLEPGKTTNIEFIADKEGIFSFFCNVFCGSGHSEMRGTLIVQ
tara:strand:- start:41138 stop:41566 length:429 start_codon:yes stop_codon:yes gene_type:complete